MTHNVVTQFVRNRVSQKQAEWVRPMKGRVGKGRGFCPAVIKYNNQGDPRRNDISEILGKRLHVCFTQKTFAACLGLSCTNLFEIVINYKGNVLNVL